MVAIASLALLVALTLYQLGLNLVYTVLLVVAARGIYKHRRDEAAIAPEDVFRNPFAPGVTVLVSAHNEAVTIVDALTSLTNLRYPDVEFICVNDGSDDDTLEQLIEAFELEKVFRVIPSYLHSEPVRGVYRSRRVRNLLVVDKENGGRADANNAGLNFAEKELVCAVDADSVLEQDALLRIVAPFLQDPRRVIGAGGIIRIANGCEIDEGKVVRVRLPRNFWARNQVVEYLRAFMIGRLGWAQMNASLLISGAFGVWRRDLMIEAGGYLAETLGEDAEITLRMHRLMAHKGRPHRIVFVPDPICWTECPVTRQVLKRQRRRWSRGLGETLWANREIAFNPRYGWLGTFGYPYALVYEFFGAIVEFFGYVSLPIAFVVARSFDPTLLILFFLASLLFAGILTASAVLLEQFTYRYYDHWSDVLLLILFAFVGQLGYHQLNVWWRFLGVVDFVTGRRRSWGRMTRVGFEHVADEAA